MPDDDQGQEPFDPGAHNVDVVLAHLQQAAPDEVARVQAAEGEGKARKTVLDWAPEEPPTFEEKLGDANPYELVRAKDIAGNEYTTSRVAALVAGSTVLDKPPLDGFGLPAPTKTVLDFRAEATTDAGEPSTEPTKE